MTVPPDTQHRDTQHMSEKRRAFLEYKRAVALHGKPFFPNGVWHDVIAASLTLAIIIGLSVVWFAQANCDSWWNISCNRTSTPLEQEHYTPDDPGSIVRDDKGEPVEGAEKPVLGLLYEEKADPATTSYHPRPEWYFYFLFYLLILFSNPQLVVLGTIGLPTIWLMLLIAWPFLDRKRERRPSRRPVAMAAMVVTAITLLSFSYLGSRSGIDEGSGPSGLSPAQEEMAGYKVLFEEGVYETCQSCHELGGVGNPGPGPNLDEVGTRYDETDELTLVLANGLGGGAMPVKGGSAMTDEQSAQVAAFLKTLGDPDVAEDPELTEYGLKDWQRATGSGEGEEGAAGDASSESAPEADSDAEGGELARQDASVEGDEAGIQEEPLEEDADQ